MKHGHVTGTKRERRPPAQPWYAAIEEEACQRIEATWQSQADTDTTAKIKEGDEKPWHTRNYE